MKFFKCDRCGKKLHAWEAMRASRNKAEHDMTGMTCGLPAYYDLCNTCDQALYRWLCTKVEEELAEP